MQKIFAESDEALDGFEPTKSKKPGSSPSSIEHSTDVSYENEVGKENQRIKGTNTKRDDPNTVPGFKVPNCA